MVTLSRSDRRRTAAATIITIVALPALWLAGRDEADQGGLTPVAAALPGVGAAPPAPRPTPSPTTTRAPAPTTTIAALVPDDTPVFLSGPTAPPSPPSPSTSDVATATNQALGQATFRRFDSGLVATLRSAPCQTHLAPAGTRITITNVNNGRSVRCTNVSIEPPMGRATLVVHTDALLAIADLVDAPITVRLTW
jgi:hypothetical protein